MDLIGGEGEVTSGDPGDLARRPQSGQAHRRSPPAGHDEVQRRGQVQHEGFEELLERIARSRLDVVEQDQRRRVDRCDRRAHRRRQRRRVVRVIG